jgi:general secretion pathway protein D
MPAERTLTALCIRGLACCGLALLLTSCSSLALDEAEQLARAGEYEQSYAALDRALGYAPNDARLRTAHSRARDRVVVRALAQADLALAAGRTEEGRRQLDRVRQLDPKNLRLAAIESNLQRSQREQALAQSRRTGASPSPAAAQAALVAAVPRGLGPAFQKPVTLEFRDAPLRQVFESLSRTTAVNFIFDKDVRSDVRITAFLRNVSLDEALKVVLATQQLDRKLLNDNTVLVYPNTPAKQREHQELITRSLYLTNADVKQALVMVRAIAKTRDLHADERLNALVIRDTPEVVALVEKLLATIDLPDPEVMMAIEILEVSTSRVDALGISWPGEVQFGLPNVTGLVPLNGGGFRSSIVNPAMVAALKATLDDTNLLANPTIRARNHEKAKVQIGEKLPVFTTTSAAANVGASTTVSLLDVGLKLDIEPTVQLDGEVTMRIALEVSNLLQQVNGPNGSVAYRLGTRLTSTSLRLRDGETQVLAGLINDEDRKSINGLPGLSKIPFLGRLFGANSDSRTKTEIVMLITPHIVRNLALPDPADATLPSGTDTQPGAPSLRLRPQASAGLAPGNTGRQASSEAAPDGAAAGTESASRAASGALMVSATAEAGVGETASVTLANRSVLSVQGELEFDPASLRLASGGTPGDGRAQGRAAFNLGPQQDAVLIFRVLSAAAGSEQRMQLASASGRTADGQPADVPVEGQALIRIRPAGAPK